MIICTCKWSCQNNETNVYIMTKKTSKFPVLQFRSDLKKNHRECDKRICPGFFLFHFLNFC